MTLEARDPDYPRPPEARYANYFEIGHDAFEFLLDFGQSYSESAGPRLHTRIVVAPRYAKALCDTLFESLARYERMFGSIPGNNEDITPPDSTGCRHDG